MALPLDNQRAPIEAHRQVLKEQAAFLLPLISEAIETLKARFGLIEIRSEMTR